MRFCPSVHQEHHFFRFNSHEYHLATGCSIRFVHKKPKENLKISRNCGSHFNLTFFFFFSKFRIAGYLEPRMNINFSADREFLLTKMTKHNINQTKKCFSRRPRDVPISILFWLQCSKSILRNTKLYSDSESKLSMKVQ